MNLKSFSAAAATGVLTLGLVLGAPTSAEAKVKAKDAPSKADIIKAFPELDGGTFDGAKTKKISVPGKSCGTNKNQSVKSGFTNTGVSTDGTSIVVGGAAEFKSASQAKKYMKKFKKFVTKCKSFTHSETGATVVVKKVKAPKLGQDRIALVQTSTVSIGGFTAVSHSSSMVIRNGKRIGEVAAIDDAAISKKKVNKLAKVVAKKMK